MQSSTAKLKVIREKSNYRQNEKGSVYCKYVIAGVTVDKAVSVAVDNLLDVLK